jgi:hypothetical protein
LKCKNTNKIKTTDEEQKNFKRFSIQGEINKPIQLISAINNREELQAHIAPPEE